MLSPRPKIAVALAAALPSARNPLSVNLCVGKNHPRGGTFFFLFRFYAPKVPVTREPLIWDTLEPFCGRANPACLPWERSFTVRSGLLRTFLRTGGALGPQAWPQTDGSSGVSHRSWAHAKTELETPAAAAPACTRCSRTAPTVLLIPFPPKASTSISERASKSRLCLPQSKNSLLVFGWRYI